MVAAEAQDVAVIGAAKSVDRLVFVADDEEVAPAFRRAGEQCRQLVLGRVRVLKLVHQHVAPLVLILAAHFFILA